MQLLTPVPMPDMLTELPQACLAAALRLCTDQRLDQEHADFVSRGETQPKDKWAGIGCNNKIVAADSAVQR